MRAFTAALILSLVLLPSAAVSGQQPTPADARTRGTRGTRGGRTR